MPEIVLLLGDVYERACRGDAPDEVHHALADYFGCHQEVHTAAWALWRSQLEWANTATGPVGAWFDYAFYEAVPVE